MKRNVLQRGQRIDAERLAKGSGQMGGIGEACGVRSFRQVGALRDMVDCDH